MTVELRKLSPDDGEDVYNLLQEIPADENGFENTCYGLSYDEYKKWLVQNDNIANGIDLEPWMVPQNIYWLYVDGSPVGVGKLRHRLTPKLEQEGGHCGVCIVASQRNKGYGKLLSEYIVKEANTLGIEKLLLTIRNDNTASIQTAKQSGGIVEKVTDDLHYIWIKTRA